MPGNALQLLTKTQRRAAALAPAARSLLEVAAVAVAGLITALIGRRVQLRLRGHKARTGGNLGERERAALELCGPPPSA